jgi:hypothetical protein
MRRHRARRCGPPPAAARPRRRSWSPRPARRKAAVVTPSYSIDSAGEDRALGVLVFRRADRFLLTSVVSPASTTREPSFVIIAPGELRIRTLDPYALCIRAPSGLDADLGDRRDTSATPDFIRGRGASRRAGDPDRRGDRGGGGAPDATEALRRARRVRRVRRPILASARSGRRRAPRTGRRQKDLLAGSPTPSGIPMPQRTAVGRGRTPGHRPSPRS